MENFDTKNLGKILIILSILLLFILTSVKMNYDKNGAVLCEAIAESPSMDMENCPYHNNNNSWLIVLAFSIVFLILGGGIFLFLRNKQLDYKQIDFSRLNEEEKQIYNLIKEKDGSIYQSEIMKELEFSKVKTTRLLDLMESKKILERKRRGMTNIIILK
ncbi:hypothetical protein J4459_02195 [Candidatus Woesearchaeota archaeon]|nr:hypothetical protein [Candidatus Woesearchaeota archaeon]